MRLPFDIIRDHLVNSRVFERREGAIGFKYAYIRYYFVASYLRDHIEDPGVRNDIVALCADLGTENSANILLFLAHLSKNSLVVDQLMTGARAQYAESAPATLTADVAFVETAEEEIDEIDLEVDTAEHRRKSFAALDEKGEAALATNSGDDDQEYLRRLRVGLRTLQIAGQVLKNFPGSLKRDAKRDLTRECYALGRRMLGWGLDVLRAAKDDMSERIITELRREHPDLGTEKATRLASRTVAGLCCLMVHGVIWRIAVAVGSPNLEETYAEVRRDASEPIVDLIDIAVRLDQMAGFPKTEIVGLYEEFASSWVGQTALRAFVVNHIYMFPVDFRVKQSVCDRIGLSYKRVQEGGARGKLVSGGE